VYDVKEYAPNHPGGDEYLLTRLGTDIEEAFEEAEHTKSASRILSDLKVVGTVGAKDESTSSNNDEGSPK
jgi:cytochrome b involved in lipid metabolism